MLEKTIKKAVKKRLEELGAYQYWPVPTGLSKATLDILVCYKGKFYAIETKAPGASLTMRQKFTSEEMQLAGAKVLVIDNLEVARTFTIP
jgi:hypothetical protein